MRSFHPWRGVLRVSAVVAVAITISACGESLKPTSGFVPSHVSTVTGRVFAQDGRPMAAVQIYVYAPGFPYGASYAVTSTFSDASGNFSLPVQRMVSPLAVPSPDTVRVTLAAVRPDRNLAQLRDSVLLTFVPFGETPTAARADLRFQN